MENNNRKFSLDPELDDLIESYNKIRNDSPRYGINKAKMRNIKKEDLKNKPSKRKGNYKLAEKTKNRVKMGIAGILAIATICGVSSCVANEKKESKPQPSTNITTHVAPEENLRMQIKNAEDDFINYYLEAYNELYETDYDNAELIVTDLKDGAVFKTEDGKLVTRGSLPDETKKVLIQYGEVDLENGHEKVIQVVTNDGKNVLGTYDFVYGEYIYSGNDLTDFKKSQNDENFKEPTTENLGINFDYMYRAADLERARGREEEDSLNSRLNACKRARSRVDARNADKNITTENDTTKREQDGFDR